MSCAWGLSEAAAGPEQSAEPAAARRPPPPASQAASTREAMRAYCLPLAALLLLLGIAVHGQTDDSEWDGGAVRWMSPTPSTPGEADAQAHPSCRSQCTAPSPACAGATCMKEYGAMLQACGPAMAGFGPDVLNATEPVPPETTAQLAGGVNPSSTCCEALKAWFTDATTDRQGGGGEAGSGQRRHAEGSGSGLSSPGGRSLCPAGTAAPPAPPPRPTPVCAPGARPGRCACDPGILAASEWHSACGLAFLTDVSGLACNFNAASAQCPTEEGCAA